MYDEREQERLAFDGEMAVGVMGRAGKFSLIPIGGDEDDALTEDALRKGYAFCGVFALVEGQTAVRVQPDPDAIFTMAHASLAFARLVTGRIRQQRTDDFVQFAEGLHTLEDTRN